MEKGKVKERERADPQVTRNFNLVIGNLKILFKYDEWV